jgi:hypothetical protein
MKSSQIERNLNAILDEIEGARDTCSRGKFGISNTVSSLANIPTKWAATIEAIGALGAGANDYERALIARYNAYVANFTALRSAAQGAQASLASVTEF